MGSPIFFAGFDNLLGGAMWVINELQDFDIAFNCDDAKQNAISCPKGVNIYSHYYPTFRKYSNINPNGQG